MKNLIAFLILALGFISTTNAQVEKTLVKSVALEGSTTAIAVLPGQVEVTEWDNDFVRVTTNLEIENMNENIAKQLVIVGRYSLSTQLDQSTNTLTITMPNIENRVTVKGVELIEVFNVKVSIPKGYEIVVKETVAVEKTTM